MSTNVIAAEGSLLWTPEEINHLVSHNGTPAKTLDNIVQMIQRRFDTDVCSVYLLEPDRANLVLAATVGLRADSVGRVRMRLDEGLAGLVAEQFKPLMVEDAARHPRFKYFRESGEDPYRSFLGVPLVDRGLLQGVLVVQTAESRSSAGRDASDGRRRSAARTDHQRNADARAVRRPVVPPALGIGSKSVVELGPRIGDALSRSRSGSLAAIGPQSDRALGRNVDRDARAAGTPIGAA